MAKKKRVPRISESCELAVTSEASTTRGNMPPPAKSPRNSRGSPKETPPKNLANKRMELMRKIISPENDNNNVITKAKRSRRKINNLAENTEIELKPQARQKNKKETAVLVPGDTHFNANTEAQNIDSRNMTAVLPSTSGSNQEIPQKVETKQRKTELNKQSLTIRKDKTKINKIKIKCVDPIELVNNETIDLTTLPRISKRKGKEETITQNLVINDTCSQTSEMNTTEYDNIDMLPKRPNETPQMYQLRLSIMKKQIANKRKNSKKNQKKKEKKALSKDEVTETIRNEQLISTEEGLNVTLNTAKFRHTFSNKRIKRDIKSVITECAKDTDTTAVKTKASETIVMDASKVVKHFNETPHMAKIRLSLAEKRMSVEKSKTLKRETVTNTPGTSTPVTATPRSSRSGRTVARTSVDCKSVTMPVASNPLAKTSVVSDPVTRMPVATRISYVEIPSETLAHKQNNSFVREKEFTTTKHTNETPAMVKLRESIAEKQKSIGISLEKKRKHVDSVIRTPESNRNDNSSQSIDESGKKNVSQTLKIERIFGPSVPKYSQVGKTMEVCCEITECRTRKDKKVVGTANKRLAMLRKWLTEGENISDVEMTPLKDEQMEWQDIAQHIMEVRIEEPTTSIDYSSQIDEQFSSSAVPFNNPQKRLLAVVDTNVFISNLDSLRNVVQAFDAANYGGANFPIFVVAWRVLLELDALKLKARLSTPARRACAFLRQHLESHPLVQGQSLEQASEHIHPCESADDEILNYCLQLSKAGQQVVLLSNDNNLCCKVKVNGVKACSVSDLMKTVSTSPSHKTTTSSSHDTATTVHDKHINNSINNNVLKAKRRLTNTKTPNDVKCGTSFVKTNNLSSQRFSDAQNSTVKSPEKSKIMEKPSFASNSSLQNITCSQNVGTISPENENLEGKSRFGSNLSFNVTTSRNLGFTSPENVKVGNSVSSQVSSEFKSLFGSSLGLRDQNDEYMKNFQDSLLPVLNHLLELCFKRQFGENYAAPHLSLEQALHTALQHWSELPSQPLSEELRRALDELRLVWIACSQGGQCSSFHVSRARQVADELLLAANNVKLATDQLMPAFEVVWTFFSNYCTSLLASECSIQHEVHTQLLKLLEALNRVISLSDVMGLHEVLRSTLDGIGRAEVSLSPQMVQVFCTNNRSLVEEARTKFSQLATALSN